MSFDLDRIGAGLPVAQHLTEIRGALAQHSRLVLQAPPGTGKTTLIPPLLAEAGRVVVTQPRRVATRAAAARLAQLSGTELGGAVGYRVRGDSRISRDTQVEFCTAGVLLRRLLAEPDLPGVSAVVLDEVHERQLDADLVFALVREVADLRDDLRVVAMSATLAAGRFATLLGEPESPAPVITVAGSQHPLAVEWATPPAGVSAFDARGVTNEFLAHVARRTVRALADHEGDALVFLPGVREVEQVVGLLTSADISALPLHGRLSPAEQQAVLNPDGQRRVVVATSIAESSLTVPGVRIVIDAGLSREPRYDQARGMSGLATRTESRASAEQRAGRAARVAPGVVVRCFAAETWARLDEAPTPEILRADLTRVALDLACWGTPRGEGLTLIDPPPTAAMAKAEEVLQGLGAVDSQGRATDQGQRLAKVPVDPRLARGLFVGAEQVGGRVAADVVAALESDQRAPGAAIPALVQQLRRGASPAAMAWRREAQRLQKVVPEGKSRLSLEEAAGVVVAAAFPDRIARRRGDSGGYLLASGTGADLPRDHALGRPEWLAVAHLDRTTGRGSGAIIRAAAPLTAEQALLAGSALLTDGEEADWANGRVNAARVRRLGAITLSSTPIRPSPQLATATVAATLAEQGLGMLEWSPAAIALRRRLAFVHEHRGEPWPAVDDQTLLADPDSWLGPEMLSLADGASTKSLDLVGALRRLLPWPQAGELDDLVPERLTVPTGSRIRLDYPDDPTQRPVLAVKLQECFGLTTTPLVAGVPVLFHLLSPAGRPLAVTDDLASFWVNAYPQVRAENRGRYPKHPWPEDPLTAPPRRGTTRSGR